MPLIEDIVAQADEMAALRRDIHAHPELCFEEVRTADVIAARLTEWGIAVHRGLGKTGVVGIVHGRDAGACGRAVGLRADMDALPMQEGNQFAHASRHPGKMHGCGHDGHVAMLLAAARHLAHQRDFDGTIYLIFQPAEEGGGGAREMIRDGLFTRFPMQAVYGPAWPRGGWR
jgi:amidohydrolase